MQNLLSDDEHEKLMEILPWMVTKTLSAEEQQQVESHARDCEECQRQLQLLQQVNKQVHQEKPAWEPSAAHFSALLEQVDRMESIAAMAGRYEHQPVNRRWLDYLQDFFQASSAMRWTLGLETAALALLLVWVVPVMQRDWTQRDPVYQTLSDVPDEHKALNTTQMRLLPSTQMATAELSALLREAGAQIRQGPSALGLFVIEVPSERAEKAKKLIAEHEGIRLIEIIEDRP